MDVNKEINNMISIAKSIDELVDLLTEESVVISDLTEFNEIIPTIKPIIRKFEEWLNGSAKQAIPAITVTTAAPATTVTTTAPETASKCKQTRRKNISESDLNKIGKIIKNNIPDNGLVLTLANRKMLKQKLADFEEQLFKTQSTFPRILRIERYPQVLSKYFRYEDGKIFKA